MTLVYTHTTKTHRLVIPPDTEIERFITTLITQLEELTCEQLKNVCLMSNFALYIPTIA